MQTTTGTLYWRMTLYLPARFAAPRRTASGFSVKEGRIERLTGHDLADSAMHLQRRIVATITAASGRRPEAPALDVEELLRAHVCAETALGADDVAGCESEPVGKDRAVAVAMFGEGAAVNERRATFERLEQVGLESVLEKDGHDPATPRSSAVTGV